MPQTVYDAYVRIGSTKDSRLISINSAPLSQKEALEMGFAIDGDSLIFEVAPTGDLDEDGRPYGLYGCLVNATEAARIGHDHGNVADALRCTQLKLVEVFAENDVGISFE